MIEVFNSVLRARVREAVFFPFDDHSIPLRAGVAPRLIGGKKFGWQQPIVIRNGPPGSHDSMILYYGTAIQFEDEVRLWYLGWDSDPTSPYFERQFPGESRGRLCYAVSKDGVNWEKPELGLVEHSGSKKNNIVDFPQGSLPVSLAVLHDADDPDPNKRFKMAYQNYALTPNRMCIAYSGDGLRWNDGPNNPVGPKLELSGLAKVGDYYVVNGQGGFAVTDAPGRQFDTLTSYDFESWRHGGVHSMARTPIPGSPFLREEIHLGAALHNRGNVILGVCGQWHFPHSEDRRQVVVDLGLCVSNDGLHFREPIPNFKFVSAAEELETPFGLGPGLVQGQGMAHFGDKTYYYYGVWPSGGHIRMATWERDRFGHFACLPGLQGRCLTCPFRVENDHARVSLNADGLGEQAQLLVEVVDEKFGPIAGFSGESGMMPITANGFRIPVPWKGGDRLPKSDSPVRLRVNWRGIRAGDVRLFAIYVE